MKAIIKDKPGSGDWPRGLKLEDRPKPQHLKPEEVLIRVLAAGICGTDVGIYNSKKSIRDEMLKVQTPSVTIGHEFCGAIAAAGDEARLRLAAIVKHHAGRSPEIQRFVGDRSNEAIARDTDFLDFVSERFRVSAEMHVTCGWCYQCRLGDHHVCRNTIIKGVHEDGAFAEFVRLPVSNLVLFRNDELPVEIIAFMDALGNAVHTVQSVNVTGRSVMVLGCGVQGLMAVAVARRAGAARIYVTDVAQESRGISHLKLEQARFRMARHFGADACFDLSQPGAKQELRTRILDDTDGTGVDAALEMSGSYAAYRDAFDCLRMGGTLSLLGIPEGEISIDFAHDVIFRGITVQGIIGRKVFETWETMRNLLASGLAAELLDSGFVSHQLALEKFEDGIGDILQGNALKVILKP